MNMLIKVTVGIGQIILFPIPLLVMVTIEENLKLKTML